MIFLDSSVIIAYKNADDINHKKAQDIFHHISKGKYGKAVISEFILSEVTTVLALKINLDAAVEVGNVLLDAREIEIVKASDVFERAWEIFRDQGNTNFSFVVTSILACMELGNIKRIATFDKDFLTIQSLDVVRE
ncbi:MAG: PIN domain-containing protein [Methanosarcinales archaeon]|nr:PIN domain-containing protein [Methanosarcinales archaeon]